MPTLLEFVPEKILVATDAFAVGPEGPWENLAWLTATTGRRALGLALYGMVRSGALTEPQAVELARRVLRDHARKLYGEALRL